MSALPAEAAEPTLPTGDVAEEAQRNSEDVYCKHCQTKIFKPRAAKVVQEGRVIKGGGLNGLDPGYMEWYDVEDKMQFENIAFLRGHEVEERRVVLEKEVDEGLGTQFQEEDEMVLEELMEGGAVERAGLHDLIGWSLATVEGIPVSCCDDVREIAPPLTQVKLLFQRARPSRILVCAGCERDVLGFTDGTRYSIAVKLVDTGSEARPTTVIAAGTPEADQLAALLQQQTIAGAPPGESAPGK
eukprot:TRINITY_DN37062_c0_g1_i1.p2 TRINITY_DN37062_c0_g1~~TRINITY_DN37062_c0_g1_i1.p2  ORF type:complete len:243 (+),score=81.78 TRINITY_DN37062_c0_g1_i1:69-797(+)